MCVSSCSSKTEFNTRSNHTSYLKNDAKLFHNLLALKWYVVYHLSMLTSKFHQLLLLSSRYSTPILCLAGQWACTSWRTPCLKTPLRRRETPSRSRSWLDAGIGHFICSWSRDHAFHLLSISLLSKAAVLDFRNFETPWHLM